MAYFKTCLKCGCNLDPEEKCDCEVQLKIDHIKKQKLFNTEGNGQMLFNFCLEEKIEEKVV